MKKLIIALAGCAFVAPLAFGQPPQTTTELTVTGAAPAITVEGGEAASYQPRKTLVVRHQGSGQYILEGRGHVFDSKGERVRTAVRPGARVQVYFANNGGVKTIERVIVN